MQLFRGGPPLRIPIPSRRVNTVRAALSAFSRVVSGFRDCPESQWQDNDRMFRSLRVVMAADAPQRVARITVRPLLTGRSFAKIERVNTRRIVLWPQQIRGTAFSECPIWSLYLRIASATTLLLSGPPCSHFRPCLSLRLRLPCRRRRRLLVSLPVPFRLIVG
jgi:hypothetical protein